MNFYTQKKKNHLPAVILKFLTTTPNLKWNFETHKNIGDNFDYTYKYMCTLSMYPNGINIIEGYFDTKSELLEPKKEKSPTCFNFEIFEHDPQLDMKFWNQ